MRVPVIRFGGDDRPLEPWEERLAPVVVPLLFAVVLLVSAVGVCLVLAWAVVSPVLPRSWRLNWDTAFDPDPSIDAGCPTCQARLSPGPVDRRGHLVRTDRGREVVLPSQVATCPGCGRSFRRFSLGKVWSPWRELGGGK